jgi:hypothetical protein
MVAPLNKASAHPFGSMPLESELIAPLYKMFLSKHIFIVSASPNEDHWSSAYRMHPIVDEYHSIRYLDKIAWLYGSGGQEKWTGGHAVAIFGRDGSLWSPPIDLDSHAFGGGIATIFPSRLGSKASDEKVRVGFVALRQIFSINDFTICGRGQFEVEPIQKNEGPFSGFQRFSSQPNLMMGRTPEGESKKSNPDCREGGYSTAIFLQKIDSCPNATNEAAQRRSPWIAVGFMIVFALTLIASPFCIWIEFKR